MALNDAGVMSAEELHTFANYLKQTSEDLTNIMSRTVKAMDYVNQGWDDKVQLKFAQEFNEALNTIADLVSAMEEHSEYVHRKAGIIDEYLHS